MVRLVPSEGCSPPRHHDMVPVYPGIYVYEGIPGRRVQESAALPLCEKSQPQPNLPTPAAQRVISGMSTFDLSLWSDNNDIPARCQLRACGPAGSSRDPASLSHAAGCTASLECPIQRMPNKIILPRTGFRAQASMIGRLQTDGALALRIPTVLTSVRCFAQQRP